MAGAELEAMIIVSKGASDSYCYKLTLRLVGGAACSAGSDCLLLVSSHYSVPGLFHLGSKSVNQYKRPNKIPPDFLFRDRVRSSGTLKG